MNRPMMTVTQMKRQTAALLDNRRSLVTELEASRRVTAELDRECETLRREARRLQEEVQRRKAAEHLRASACHEVEQVRRRLAAEQRNVQSLMRERNALTHRATAGSRELGLALERARELGERHREAVARRDLERERLDDALVAMVEVRTLLRSVAPA